MKSTFKRILCVLGAAAMLSSAMAVSASAKLPVIINKTTETTKVEEPVKEMYGCKYYGVSAGEIREYFKPNVYEISMRLGEKRVMASNVLFFSENTSIVSFDAATGALKANGVGKTAVYVCTKNGIPFLKLLINVKDTQPSVPQLSVRPGSHYLYAVGDKTNLSVLCPNNKYNDYVYSIVAGKDCAYIKDGMLIAKGEGAVVVRVHSKSCPTVWGETIVFVGEDATSSIDDVRYFYENIYNPYAATILGTGNGVLNGWIVDKNGNLLPVIKLEKFEVTNSDGTTTETVIGIPTFTTYKELIHLLYCDKEDDKPGVHPGHGVIVKPGYGNGVFVKPGYGFCNSGVKPHLSTAK